MMNQSNARKHSDSRLETRFSRSKNINSSSNATDSLIGGHSCSTSTTRKRKIESCESVAAATAAAAAAAAGVSNLDADSSGGDGSGSTTSIHQSSQAKFSKHDEITSQQSMLAAGSPSSSSSSSQDDVVFMNLMMTNDEDSFPGASVQSHQLQSRFCEGLGDQRIRCPGVHRFEVYVSDTTNLLGQQGHQGTNSISSDVLKFPPLMNGGGRGGGGGGYFTNGRQQSFLTSKQSYGNFDSLSNIFGSSGLPGGGIVGGGWSPAGGGVGGNLLTAGNAFYKNQKVPVKRFVFECELGDKWIESPIRKSCRPLRSAKPASSVNQVMNRLELQGVKFISVLSSGKFSQIFVGHLFSPKHKVAIKIYEKKLKNLRTTNLGGLIKQNLKVFSPLYPYAKSDAVPDEISIHRHLRHRNVVQLLYSEQVDQHHVSLMELCDHGSLSQLLRVSPGSVLAEPICRRYFRDMLEALAYLHSQNIVHRDIRCENFLVDYHDTIKLCDFTHAARFSNGDELQTTWYGNPAYLSPEILEEKPFNPRTADVWALGVCLHILCTSKPPFLSSSSSSSSSPTSNSTPEIQSANRTGEVHAVKSNQMSGLDQHQHHQHQSGGHSSNQNRTPSSADLQNAEENFTGKLSVIVVPESTVNNNPAGSSSKSFDSEPLLVREATAKVSLEAVQADPLTLMKKGLDLKTVAPSVNLSHEIVELLKGLLHYVLKVRYSLNRARSSAWMKQNGAREEEDSENEKPYIGNHYLLGSHQKFASSEKEKALKEAF